MQFKNFNHTQPNKINLDKGFTLIEIIIVIAIIAILAGIALPIYSSIQEDAKGAKVLTDLSYIESAANIYAIKNGYLPRRISPTDTSGDYDASPLKDYLAAWPVAPTGNIKIKGYNGVIYRYKLGSSSDGAALTYAWNGVDKDGKNNMDRATLGRTTIDMLMTGKPNTRYITFSN